MTRDANTKVERFVVEGSGEFPFDMLRYDSCWPATAEDAAKLQSFYRDKRRVELRSDGYMTPTPERWASFNWRVVSEETDG